MDSASGQKKISQRVRSFFDALGKKAITTWNATKNLAVHFVRMDAVHYPLMLLFINLWDDG